MKSQTPKTRRLLHFIRSRNLNNHDVMGDIVLLLHGNLSTSAFWKPLVDQLDIELAIVAPDLRGFGDTEPKPIDATRGVSDWTDDVEDLVTAIFPNLPPSLHLVGWSLGGGIAMDMVMKYPGLVASLTLICPISPYGFGGTRDAAGTPFEDFSGSGGAVVADEFVERLRNGDSGDDSPLSPRNIVNEFYFHPPFRAEDEELFLTEVLKTRTGIDHYPGDWAPSPKLWPFVRPGKHGVLNAISPEYFDASALPDLPHKPPVLWLRGQYDRVISNTSAFDVANLGNDFRPGYPGAADRPPQPMIDQTAAVLDAYERNGGKVWRPDPIPNTAHAPHVERPKIVADYLTAFLNDILG